MKSVNKEFYIVEEKGCIFIVEMGEIKPDELRAMEISTSNLQAKNKMPIEGVPKFIAQNIANKKGKVETSNNSGAKPELPAEDR